MIGLNGSSDGIAAVKSGRASRRRFRSTRSAGAGSPVSRLQPDHEAEPPAAEDRRPAGPLVTKANVSTGPSWTAQVKAMHYRLATIAGPPRRSARRSSGVAGERLPAPEPPRVSCSRGSTDGALGTGERRARPRPNRAVEPSLEAVAARDDTAVLRRPTRRRRASPGRTTPLLGLPVTSRTRSRSAGLAVVRGLASRVRDTSPYGTQPSSRGCAPPERSSSRRRTCRVHVVVRDRERAHGRTCNPLDPNGRAAGRAAARRR